MSEFREVLREIENTIIPVGKYVRLLDESEVIYGKDKICVSIGAMCKSRRECRDTIWRTYNVTDVLGYEKRDIIICFKDYGILVRYAYSNSGRLKYSQIKLYYSDDGHVKVITWQYDGWSSAFEALQTAIDALMSLKKLGCKDAEDIVKTYVKPRSDVMRLFMDFVLR